MIQCRENNIPKIKTKNKQTNSYSKRNKNYLGQLFGGRMCLSIQINSICLNCIKYIFIARVPVFFSDLSAKRSTS